MFSQADSRLRLLNWLILLATLGLLVLVFAPFQMFLTLGLAALVLLVRILMEILAESWIRYFIYLFVLAAIITAGFLDGNQFYLFLSMVGLLVLWNFDFWYFDLKRKYQIRNESVLDKKYLLTIGLISISSIILMAITSSIQLEFKFGVILLLGFLLIFSLSRLLRVQRDKQV